MDVQRVIGVDVGGSGVKAALVNLANGELASGRLRVATPQPATPDRVAGAVVDLVEQLGGAPSVGVTIPAVVRSGVARTAANIDPAWVGTDARTLFTQRLGVPCVVLNDADAAGLAEMRFGAGKGRDGVVILLTLGTGIGSALFVDGVLVPNTEFGHMEFKAQEAEHYAAAAVRKTEQLSWEHWGRRLGQYLAMLTTLFSPELFILGGGVSRKFDKFSEHLSNELPEGTEVVAATLQNQAGIVGAAMAMEQRTGGDETPVTE